MLTFVRSCLFAKLATWWSIYFLIRLCNFPRCSSICLKRHRGICWSLLSADHKQKCRILIHKLQRLYT